MNEIILEVMHRKFKSLYMVPLSNILYLYAAGAGSQVTIELSSGRSLEVMETWNGIKDQINKQRRLI